MPSRSGVILVIVLVVIALLALSAYTFSDRMLAHHAAADVHAELAQSQALVQSGAAATRAFLMQPPLTQQQLGGTFDNPSLFQAQLVVEDAEDAFRGMFSIVAPLFDNVGYPIGIRYGLQNESAKLNLTTLIDTYDDEEDISNEQAALDALIGGLTGSGDPSDDDVSGAGDEQATTLESLTSRSALMQLPGMTLEIADAILDWMDEDDEPREFGAEIDFYSSQQPASRPKNGPFDSLSELLMVRGVTPELLFGRDRNRNGVLDANEAETPLAIGVDPALGSLDLGWQPFLTLHSRELPLAPTGEARININDEDLEALYGSLSAVIDADLATFIIVYRQNGPAEEEEAEEGEAVGGRAPDLTRSATTEIENILDLVGVRVRARLPDADKPVVLTSPLVNEPQAIGETLAQLLDYVTTDGDQSPAGRININEAPLPVLMTVPGMTRDVADTIAAQSGSGAVGANTSRRHPIWLMSEGLVDLPAMRQMLPYVTGGGSVFQAQVVGFNGDGGRISRAEVLIDASRPDVPIVGWKDLTAAGRGFTPTDLRSP